LLHGALAPSLGSPSHSLIPIFLIVSYSGWKKFNSNSGWKDKNKGWSEVFQALSHWSYHNSGGEVLLCDIQGGIDDFGAILTDPVIASTTAGRYGPADLGMRGISTFFSQHVCNEYCRDHWIRPVDQKVYIPVTSGTSMESSGSISALGVIKPHRQKPAKVPSHMVGSADGSGRGGGGARGGAGGMPMGGWSSFLADPRWGGGVLEEGDEDEEDEDDY
jgi:Alpha-kinase family